MTIGYLTVIGRGGNLGKLKLTIIAVLLILTTLGISGYTIGQLNKQLPTPASQSDAYASPTLLSLVNQVRAKGGKPALTEAGELATAAQYRNQFMIDQGVWNHDGSDGSHWYNVDEQYAPMHTKYGENLASCYKSNTEVVDAWIKSPEHYAIMMGDYTQVGFNTVYESKTLTDTYHPGNLTFNNCYLVAAEFSN